jgi:hypothetical protein
MPSPLRTSVLLALSLGGTVGTAACGYDFSVFTGGDDGGGGPDATADAPICRAGRASRRLLLICRFLQAGMMAGLATNRRHPSRLAATEQHPARRARQGARATRPSIRALCRRLVPCMCSPRPLPNRVNASLERFPCRRARLPPLDGHLREPTGSRSRGAGVGGRRAPRG